MHSREYKCLLELLKALVLGPFFRNIVWDSLLEMELTRGARIIRFADDTVLAIEAASEIQLEIRMEEIQTYKRSSPGWMKSSCAQNSGGANNQI